MSSIITIGTAGYSDRYQDVQVSRKNTRYEYHEHHIDYVIAPMSATNDTTQPQKQRDQVRATLVAAGLSLPTSGISAVGKLSPEEREELARRISGGQPLSDIIVEERRDR